jgi:hypothetical protein
MAVIVKFLASHLMPTALDVGEHLVGAAVFQSSRYAAFAVDLSNLLLVLSSSTNFWIYLLFGGTFRTSLVEMISEWCHCLMVCCDNGKENNSETTMTIDSSKSMIELNNRPKIRMAPIRSSFEALI